jgi:hypothetical protein
MGYFTTKLLCSYSIQLSSKDYKLKKTYIYLPVYLFYSPLTP